MKLTCSRSALATALNAVGAVVPTRTPKDILLNVKLRAEGDRLVLMGTDQEVGMRYELADVRTDRRGDVLLPTRRSLDILREVRDDQVTLEATETAIVYRAGRSEFRLPVKDPAEFPDLAAFGEAEYLSIPGRTLRDMIRRTVFATSAESTRYALGGVLIELQPDRLGLVATDSRRLAITHAPCTATGAVGQGLSAPPIVPAKAMSLIERSIPDGDDPVRIAVHANDVLVQVGPATIHSRLVEGRFPRYQEVVPKDVAITVEFVADALLAVVRQALIVTSDDSRGVDFAFADGVLTLLSQSADVGQSRVEMPISYTSQPLTIRFDPRYVADFLKVLPGEAAVRLELNNGDSAATFRTEDGYVYVVMPLARDTPTARK